MVDSQSIHLVLDCKLEKGPTKATLGLHTKTKVHPFSTLHFGEVNMF